MKWFGLKVSIIVCVLMSAVVIISCSQNDEYNISSNAKAFISKHFADNKIESVVQTIDSDYIVHLDNGIEIEFERKGVWSEIDSKKNKMPESIIQNLPQKMINYIKVNYPAKYIRKIEKKSNVDRVKLNKHNAMKLCFTKNGVFIKDEAN